MDIEFEGLKANAVSAAAGLSKSTPYAAGPVWDQLMNAYRSIIAWACAKCEIPDLAAQIDLEWSSKFKSKMGDAIYWPKDQMGRIRFSTRLWLITDDEERLDTVVHEATHVIAHARTGECQGHGPFWKRMMCICGFPNASRCHDVFNNDARLNELLSNFTVGNIVRVETPDSAFRAVVTRINETSIAVCTARGNRFRVRPQDLSHVPSDSQRVTTA